MNVVFKDEYLKLRETLPKNTLLLVKMGDYYEIFLSDASRASFILEIPLCSRNGNWQCGFHVHEKDRYLPRLLEDWDEVAIAEQDKHYKWVVTQTLRRNEE